MPFTLLYKVDLNFSGLPERISGLKEEPDMCAQCL